MIWKSKVAARMRYKGSGYKFQNNVKIPFKVLKYIKICIKQKKYHNCIRLNFPRNSIDYY